MHDGLGGRGQADPEAALAASGARDAVGEARQALRQHRLGAALAPGAHRAWRVRVGPPVCYTRPMSLLTLTSKLLLSGMGAVPD